MNPCISLLTVLWEWGLLPHLDASHRPWFSPSELYATALGRETGPAALGIQRAPTLLGILGANHPGWAVECALCTHSCGMAREGPWKGLAFRSAGRTDVPPSSARNWLCSLLARSQLLLEFLGGRWWPLGGWAPIATFRRNCSMNKALGLHAGRSSDSSYSWADPLQAEISNGDMESSVIKKPAVCGKNGLSLSPFTHPFPRSPLGLGTSPSIWVPSTGFLAFSLFSLGVCIASSSSELNTCSNYVGLHDILLSLGEGSASWLGLVGYLVPLLYHHSWC